MAADPEVRTTAGTVRGRWENAVAIFRGIPYAQPPVGRHRFGYPVPTTRWVGVRDAVQFGPPAPQPDATTSDVDTEWLTLNVWSPDPGVAGLPVMVWIHGGRYLEGHTANPHQDGALLARTGVVMVSLNYRVGVEGFACIAGAPNNRGLLDQIAALHWVHDNIAAFGGNPANVSVFGQSAGGGSVASLLVMPAAKGLFHRAIAQSPPGTFFTENLAAAVAGEIAAELSARPTVAELQQFSPHTLANASFGLLRRMPDFVNVWGPMALTPTPFSPIVDGVILPDAPWRALAGGAARGINLVCGHTRDEYSLFNPLRGQPVSDELFAETVDRLGPNTCAPSQYRAAYPEATTSQLYETVNADWLFRMPCQHLATAHRAGGGTAWLYELAWGFNPDEGASHSLDMLLVLGTLDRDDITNHPSVHPGAPDEYVQVSHAMRTDWAAFAARGEPGWAAYEPNTRSTRVYDTTTTDRSYPEEASRRLWENHRFAALDRID
ncbi:carboxylesterase/lipase family protein [Mycobacterium hackensackense]|uniref:carboxylesterase/lipase family protein n=1 Tax=Mycobacterium hackensackense TaxID=228909 RepID=UPI002265DF50|nr:carboxylesterase family protein [Mycobacterium hackensackense]MCV7251158.1 carboxylesterase/lipase family protein [Mycobacterium hackensackense]